MLEASGLLQPPHTLARFELVICDPFRSSSPNIPASMLVANDEELSDPPVYRVFLVFSVNRLSMRPSRTCKITFTGAGFVLF